MASWSLVINMRDYFKVVRNEKDMKILTHYNIFFFYLYSPKIEIKISVTVVVSMATIQQKWPKKGLKALFLESLMKEYKWNLFWWHLKFAREYHEYICKVFMPRHSMGMRLIFRVFFTFQILQCSISQNICGKPCGSIRGIHVLPFNVPVKFHYLSPKHLNVTSSSLVPNFRNFSENRLFLDSNQSSMETVGNYFQLPPCLPANGCYSPSNTTWSAHFWPKNGAIKLPCAAVSLEK